MNTGRLEKYVRALKNGDNSAFDYVYESTYKAVFFTVYKVLNDKSLAEDITHEVYITAIKKLSLYMEDSNFCGWLITMAKRLAINEYNKRKKEFSVDYTENESLYGEYFVEDKADNSLMTLAKKLLNEEEYKIVMLCVMAGYKRREVAEMLNMPIGTVTWKYNEALEKIKKHYKEVE